MAHSKRFSRSVQASPDINEPVALIKRERSAKLFGAVGGLALLTAGLFAVPYLDFRHNFDPGPAETAPATMVDRGTDDQGSRLLDDQSSHGDSNDAATMVMPSDSVLNERTEPVFAPPPDMPSQSAPDTTDMNDQGARGATDRSDVMPVTRDNQPNGGPASPSSMAPSSDSP